MFIGFIGLAWLRAVLAAVGTTVAVTPPRSAQPDAHAPHSPDVPSPPAHHVRSLPTQPARPTVCL
ncbi:hypothetical protein ASD53_14565 [Lysobacter sp. Root559]|nr:hypothetical protein ASD53_14565 [Lysobacter sp. Root559]KRC31440.1 hypothetical protein ASE10_17010 [Lysobacter sp. Root76]KRD65346.1 hypothetical protein ASE45_18215 [Lysobacter sp. Root96]